MNIVGKIIFLLSSSVRAIFICLQEVKLAEGDSQLQRIAFHYLFIDYKKQWGIRIVFPLQRIACYSNCASSLVIRMIHMKTFVFIGCWQKFGIFLKKMMISIFLDW